MTRYWNHEEILGLMEALADVNANVQLSAWRCADDWAEQHQGKFGNWTGPYRYEMYARFSGGMTAEDCVRLAEIVRALGAEATLYEHGGEEEPGSFHIHPPDRLQFDSLGKKETPPS